MNNDTYDSEYTDLDMDQARATEDEVLDRTSTFYWQSLTLLDAGLQLMYVADEQESQEHAAERKAALARALAKAQSLQQHLHDLTQFRIQQWQADLQRAQAELVAASSAAHEAMAARLSAMQERQNAAVAKIKSQFQARVADLQAQRDTLNVQLVGVQKGAKAGLEQRKQEIEDHLTKAQHDLESFNSATVAAHADLQQGSATAHDALKAARNKAVSEYHAAAQQYNG